MAIIWKSNSNKRIENFDLVRKFLKEKKESNPHYKVLDAGGAGNPWASEYTDAYLDIQDVPGKKVITGDIQSPEVWEKVSAENFDFIICSHTLEDIKNPDFVIKKIIENCKEGFISVPNKHTEMSHVESLRYLGYCHHQYVFALKNETLLALRKFVLLSRFVKSLFLVPGISLLEKVTRKIINKPFLMFPHKGNLNWVNTKINTHEYELAFIWKDNFEFRYLNDDFLSSHQKYLDIVRKELKGGL